MSLDTTRQNFSDEAEAALNSQINLELYASNSYFALAGQFENESSPLPGLAAYFAKQSEEEREHAQKLRRYLVSRGGTYAASSIECPPPRVDGEDAYGAESALRSALAMERQVNTSLLNLHKTAETHGDAQMCDFVESEFLEEQIESMYEISCLLQQLKLAGGGMGLLYFDQTVVKQLIR